ncbi:MAG: LTA synthase family protein [Flavobacteriales bacterium]|nr:LTA synthase family protein [Flavobacteriales bacterium]
MPRHLLLLLKLLLYGLAIGTLFRLCLFVMHAEQWQTASPSDILHAFFNRGLLFDLYVNAWILALPALLLSLRSALGSSARWPVTVARWVWVTLSLVLLFCCCADLPFYAYTNMRLTDMALSTVQTVSQSVKELVSTPPYLMALAAFLLLAFLTLRFSRRTFHPLTAAQPAMPLSKRWPVFIAALVALFMAMRGTWDLSEAPLTAEEAYFSETPFLNQLGTNAAFSFFESLGQDKVRYMPPEEAIANARRFLGINGQSYDSPVARDVEYDEPPARPNVVLILMESLSANRLQRFGHPKRLMPFLEHLMDSSLVFERFYAAGTRTCNGIFSSLYGLPAIGSQHPLAHPTMTAQRFHGLPGTLREAGYRTSFLYPGDAAFDNMNGFLPNNGFDRFISERDFADSIPRNSWGVTDRALYRKTVEHIDSLKRSNTKPWFITLMTISSHKGYNVPNDSPMALPLSPEGDENIYQYADRTLELFFVDLRERGLMTNTVFVILGDHGQRFDPLHEVPLAYHHVPLVVYAPGLAKAGTTRGFGTQVDLPETILGLLRIPHVNNTLGKDLTREAHSLAYFCSDHRIAALDERSYWIRTGEVERLYDLASRSTEDLSEIRQAERDSLKRYAECMVQTAAWLIERRLAGKPEPTR